MKRVALLLVLLSLVISTAVPTGAVFAFEEEIDTSAATTEPEVSDTALNQPVTPVPVGTVIVSEANMAPELMVAGPKATQSSEVAPTIVEVSADPTVVAPPPVTLPSSPLIITAYKATGTHLNVVQIYNNSSNMVSLDGVSLSYVAGGEEYEIPMVGGWVKPRSYMVLAWQGESEYADIEFAFEHAGSGNLESIELEYAGYQPLTVAVPAGYSGALLQRFKSTAGNYTTNTAFLEGSPTISGGGLYVLPGTPDLSVREILVNPRSCTYGAETADCYDYIKVRNDGIAPLDLGQYRLRSGYSNTNSTATNTTYFNDVILPGATVTLTHDKDNEHVSFSANDGTVWLEDLYGYESYDLKVPPYVDSDLTAQVGRSWAYNDETGGWQWATPSPNKVENDFTPPAGKGGAAVSESTPKPCRDDQYRSEETGRCRNITTSSALTPCKEGQYRSEETNRCRSLAATVASVLKPCADDQFRNPLTNRCKSIASADDVALADCGEGRERNPETNRCRNILLSTPPEAAFAVEPIKEAANAFTGWWVLGLVVAAGTGYGIWEWRDEIGRLLRRVPGIHRP